MTDKIHTPVLLQEALSYLDPQKGKTIVDCTLGAAGHSIAIAQRGARVIGIDRDEDMVAITKKIVEEKGLADKITIIHSNFARLMDVIDSEVDGILFDLGVSSLQLDDASRGFSYSKDSGLDMRMDRSLTITAKDLINGLNKYELTKLFEKYGEIPSPHRFADTVITARNIKQISTTRELAELADKSLPRGKTHPATRVFQALRIAVNDELGELKAALPSALSLLKKGGILVVISFHSLEDRIVKNFFNSNPSIQVITKKPITPSNIEISTNPRSRSAKLRACRKISKSELSEVGS